MSCGQKSMTLATWPLRPLSSCMHNLHQRSWGVQGANKPLGILLHCNSNWYDSNWPNFSNGQWFIINKLRQHSMPVLSMNYFTFRMFCESIIFLIEWKSTIYINLTNYIYNWLYWPSDSFLYLPDLLFCYI